LRRRISEVVPTATIRLPRIAIASASFCAGFTVQNLPLMRSHVTGACPRSETTFTTSAAQAIRNASRIPLQRGGRVLEPDVLHLFFQIEPEAVTHALLQFFNYGNQIGRGARPVVVNQIGMVRRDLDVAAPNSLRSCLFEKPSGRNLPVAD